METLHLRPKNKISILHYLNYCLPLLPDLYNPDYANINYTKSPRSGCNYSNNHFAYSFTKDEGSIF